MIDLTQPNTSPVFNKPQVKITFLTFPEAVKEIINGSKVTRMDWNDSNEYGFIKDEFLCIHTKGADHTWIISKADLMAEDWIIVGESNEN